MKGWSFFRGTRYRRSAETGTGLPFTLHPLRQKDGHMSRQPLLCIRHRLTGAKRLNPLTECLVLVYRGRVCKTEPSHDQYHTMTTGSRSRSDLLLLHTFSNNQQQQYLPNLPSRALLLQLRMPNQTRQNRSRPTAKCLIPAVVLPGPVRDPQAEKPPNP